MSAKGFWRIVRCQKKGVWVAFVCACLSTGCGLPRDVGRSSLDSVTPSVLAPRVPLSTRDRFIVDAAGDRFKLAGINWYGASDLFSVPGGLDRAPVDGIVARIKEMGFNAIRFPFSNTMLHESAAVAPEHVAANPEFFGKTPLQVYDAVIERLTAAGIVVILNNHTTHPMWCCRYEEDGLWYTADYAETAWIKDWEMMARRYRDNPLVVGADLRNEIRIAKWRDTLIPTVPHWAAEPNDWRAAAGRAAAAIMQVNPQLLIIVEGVNAPRVQLQGVRNDPVLMSIPHKLVYAVHNYSFTKPGIVVGPSYGEMDFDAFKRRMDQEWGYVLAEHHTFSAPVWFSEFGLAPDDAGARSWFANVRRYLRETDADWAVWAVNSGPRADGEKETFGFLTDDWSRITDDFRLAALRELMPPRLGPGVEPDYDQRVENHFEALSLSDWDTDHRRVQDDWANHAFKATCAEGGRVVGLSHGKRGLWRYTHAALCSAAGPFADTGPSFVYGDDGKDSSASLNHTQGRDWAPGSNKLECPGGAAITGVAQYKEGLSYRLAAVRCTVGWSAAALVCAAVAVDDNDHRISVAGGDWDEYNIKTQCADQGVVAGIALSKGKPTALLCCR